MVSYRFDQEEWKTAKANQSIELDKKLASGLHRLEAICEQDTLRQEVVVFNLNDKRPAVETNDWYYLSAQRFSDSKPVYLSKAAYFSCDCEAFLYWCEVALHAKGAAAIKFSNGEAPDTRNPRKLPMICKHLIELAYTCKEHKF